MQYTKMGRSGLLVSRLVLGTMNFGSKTDEKEAFAIMDAALDAGINYFDTANNYGKSIHKEGISESIIGNWFAQGGDRREKVILSTKVYEAMPDENTGPNAGSGLSAYKIRRQFEDSLKRLKTDHVEIYYMHHVDHSILSEEILPVFQSLIIGGSIDYMASSNFAGWDIADTQSAAKQNHMFGLLCEQHKYNLMCRFAELEVLPSAVRHGLGVVAWSPLAGGMLSRNALKGLKQNGAEHKRYEYDIQLQQLIRYQNLCERLGEKEDTVALAWLLHNPSITAPIIGPSTVEQLRDSLRALEIVLEEGTLKELSEIFPGPGGAAPEAYAW